MARVPDLFCRAVPGLRALLQFACVAVLGLGALLQFACVDALESRPAGPESAAVPPQVAWLQANARSFATWDPRADDGDLAVLAPMLGDARMVGLGEATHGSSEFFRMKHRLLRYLVERHGFTAFALEADLAQCRALDAHVLNGEGEARALVAGLGMWPWATREMLELVDWMRVYNADPGHPRKVRFFGFDMQDGEAAMERLLAYVAAIDAGAGARLEGLCAGYRPFAGIANPARLPYARLPLELRLRLRSQLLAVWRWLEAHREAYVAATDAAAYAWALRMAELLLQHEQLCDAWNYPNAMMEENLRDRFMADNADWLLQQLGPGGRMVLWAHNGHINRRGVMAPLWTSSGDWLGQRHGADYLAVGFAFGAGGFNAVPADRPADSGTPRAFHLPPAGAGSFEEAFLRAGLPLAFLDLRALDLSRPGAGWFSRPHGLREIGSHFHGDRTDPGEPTELMQRFDLLVFIGSVTPSRLLGREAEAAP